MTAPEQATPTGPPLAPAPFALAVAQARTQKVTKAGKAEDYAYATLEDHMSEWRRVTVDLGLVITFPKTKIVQPVPNVFAVYRQIVVTHPGDPVPQVHELEWPIYTGERDRKSRPFDKAFATALTSSLRYFLRDVLLIPWASDDDMDSRNDSQEAAPAKSEEPKVSPERRTVVKPEGMKGPPPGRGFDSGVMRVEPPVKPGASLEENLGQGLPDENVNDPKQNNATTGPGEASSPGSEPAKSGTAPEGSSVVAPSIKDRMLAVVEAAPVGPHGSKKIPARAFISAAQAEGETTPQPPAPQEDGRSPDRQVSPSAGPSKRVLYPIEPNKDGFTDECPECDSQIANVPSDDLIHDGARLFCEKGHELAVSVRDGKAHVEPVRGGPTLDIEPRDPVASGLSCRFCGKKLAKKAAHTMHVRACSQKNHGDKLGAVVSAALNPVGPRDPTSDPRTGDVLVFEGWTYTVLSLNPGKGRKQTRLDIRKDWMDASGVKAQDSCNWSLGAWRSFFRERQVKPVTEASRSLPKPQEPMSVGESSLDVVREGLSGLPEWKEESQ